VRPLDQSVIEAFVEHTAGLQFDYSVTDSAHEICSVLRENHPCSIFLKVANITSSFGKCHVIQTCRGFVQNDRRRFAGCDPSQLQNATFSKREAASVTVFRDPESSRSALPLVGQSFGGGHRTVERDSGGNSCLSQVHIQVGYSQRQLSLRPLLQFEGRQRDCLETGSSDKQAP